MPFKPKSVDKSKKLLRKRPRRSVSASSFWSSSNARMKRRRRSAKREKKRSALPLRKRPRRKPKKRQRRKLQRPRDWKRSVSLKRLLQRWPPLSHIAPHSSRTRTGRDSTDRLRISSTGTAMSIRLLRRKSRLLCQLVALNSSSGKDHQDLLQTDTPDGDPTSLQRNHRVRLMVSIHGDQLESAHALQETPSSLVPSVRGMPLLVALRA